MGRRGPGAGRLIDARKRFAGDDRIDDMFNTASLSTAEPWEKPGLTRAERVVAFLETLPVTSGILAGERFGVRPWQRQIIEDLYAEGEDGRRIVREAVITLPRGNGKTGLLAGLALAHLCGPEAESRGQCFSAASDRDQAALLFNEMEAMIHETPALARRVNIQRFAKKIEDIPTGSVYAALSADARKAHGLNVSFYCYDELAQAPNRQLLDYLRTGTGKRHEALGIVISTQASDPLHVMSELVDYGRQVQDGVIEDHRFLPVIYAAPEDADPWDEAVWHACNPALGDFRSLDEMRRAADMARRIPAQEAAFRALYLNQRIDAESRFIRALEWEACGAPVEWNDLVGRPCWGGLDLSQSRDLTALVLVFPDDEGGIDVLPFFWCPEDAMAERAETDRVPYPVWAAQGHIEPTPGATVDYRPVIARIAEACATFDVQGIAYDRWRIEDLRRQLGDEGIDDRLAEFGQGFKDMGPAVDALERAIADKRLRHGGHPILRWNAANAVVELDPAGNRKLSKKRSREKIDGLVALAMALGVMEKIEPKAQPWALENGPMFLDL
ncbi:MAG: terminase [Rhodobacteraceae bacterium]|nr:terminase [Paracoccaceae bacterium]MBR28826.1 terminase [Paracoccaceae bacterium]